MIAIELRGRMGNQMFRYAFARALYEARGRHDNLLLGCGNYTNLDVRYGWENSLKYFKILPFEETKTRVLFESVNCWQKYLSFLYYLYIKIACKVSKKPRYKLEKLWYPLLNYLGLYYSYDNDYPFKMSTKDVILINGTFENKKYFDNIRPILLKEFTPNLSPLPHNKQMYELMRNRESVCVHVRRGDYVANKHFALKFNVCGIDYFQKAIAAIKEHVKQPVFFFFSDDINWVKNNIICNDECYFEDNCNPIWECLRLMYSCKHFIISNSTFSWWGQYLSRNENKLVVAPSIWYNIENETAHLLEDNWIKIDI